MTTNFEKLNKFEGHDFRRWQKKMHFLFTTLNVVYVLTTPMPKSVEDATIEAIRIRAKWENDDYICKGHILNGMSDSLFDVYTNVESAKKLWDYLESKYIAEDSSSKKFLVSNDNNYKMADSRPVIEQYNELLRILGQYTQHGLKMDESIYVSKESLRAQDSDKGKGKEVVGHSVNMTGDGKNKNNKQNKGNKRDFKEYDSGSGSNKKPKLECWKCGKTGHFKRYCRSGSKKNANAGGSGKESKDHSQAFYVQVDAIACVIDFDATTHVYKDRCWFKTYEPVEDGYVLYMGDDHFASVHEKGSVVLEFSLGKSITLFNVLYVPKLHRGGEYYDPVFFQYVEIIHETTALYAPQQNGVAGRKNRALKEMVNSMLSYSGLSEGFWGEAMLTAYYLLNRVPNKRNKTTPYELWYKKRPNLSFLRVWGCRIVVRLSDPKRKTLGEKGIYCIFVGYAEHSKAYQFYVIEPNDYVSINSIIESRDAIFDENHFSSIHRPKDIIPNVQEYQIDDHTYDVPIEGSRDQVGSHYSYCYNIEEEPRIYNEAMQSRDVAFWKEAINDEIGSIMENNTWVLSDLPPGCKWIFKRKMKVDGTIDKFKARLVIQGFRQKEGIDYFDTYAPVAHITAIRLLLALAAIPNLVIHQMDVKIAFLNGDLDEEVYMKQPEGFVMPGAILWASTKQTCINSSTIESEFVVLAAASKEAEWLRNLIHEILIWPKPLASIYIRCDSAPTMARAYSQIYNEKSRHLGVRHSMVRELIGNGVISNEFVQTQHNLADHLTKGLARDLVNKSVKGMLEIGTQVLSSRGARSKGTTYVNMKFSHFKKLGLSFLYVHQWIGTHGLYSVK
nr:zinc finger, CCHC-type [Tanacetum cinerariifolium]